MLNGVLIVVLRTLAYTSPKMLIMWLLI